MLILSKYLFIKPYHLTMYRHISVQWIDLMIFCLNFTFQLMEVISRNGKADIASVLATSSHHISLGAHLKWKFYITANSKFSTQELKLLMNCLSFFLTSGTARAFPIQYTFCCMNTSTGISFVFLKESLNDACQDHKCARKMKGCNQCRN